MSTSSDFLKQIEIAKQIAKEFGRSQGQGIITKVKMELGFGVSYLSDNQDKMKFWKPCSNRDEAAAIKAEIDDLLKHHKIKNNFGGDQEAEYCLRVWVSGSNILNGEARDWDYNEFHADWSWKDKDGNTCFDMIVESAAKNGLFLNQEFWGRVRRPYNPFRVRQGDAGKISKYTNNQGQEVVDFPRFSLPVEVFENEQMARAAAGGSASSTVVDNSQWSDTARKNYQDISTLINLAGEIGSWYTKMIGGTPFANDGENYPLPEPITPPKVKTDLAKHYDVETADIDILMSMDIAF
jgi:hypothetical protein